MKTAHSNVVELMYAWADANSIFLAYKIMSINLEQLYSVINLKEPDIAFICAQVISTAMAIFKDIRRLCAIDITRPSVYTSGVVRLLYPDSIR